MAHRKKKKVVQMGDRKYGLYNFNFPKSMQPKDIQSDFAEESPMESIEVESEEVELPVTIEPDIKGEIMAEEHVEQHGNVVEVIIEELDEKSDDFKLVETKEVIEPEIKAQSVVVREPVVRHVKKSFSDMRSLSMERNRNASTHHRVNRCGDCGGVQE